MRLSDFREAVDETFGEAYAPTLLREMALTNLDSLTASQALDRGVAPRDVWHALCDQMEVPDEDRKGRDKRRVIPPRR